MADHFFMRIKAPGEVSEHRGRQTGTTKKRHPGTWPVDVGKSPGSTEPTNTGRGQEPPRPATALQKLQQSARCFQPQNRTGRQKQQSKKTAKQGAKATTKPQNESPQRTTKSPKTALQKRHPHSIDTDTGSSIVTRPPCKPLLLATGGQSEISRQGRPKIFTTRENGTPALIAIKAPRPGTDPTSRPPHRPPATDQPHQRGNPIPGAKTTSAMLASRPRASSSSP